MQKALIILIISVFNISILQSQVFYTNMHLRIGNESRTWPKDLIFGAADDATDGIDTAYGEFELINHPPGGLHAYFILPPYENEFLISYIDIRPADQENKFYKEYEIDVQREGDTLVFLWGDLPPNIDSAEILDKFEGSLFSAKMDSSYSAKVGNEFLDRFIIKVWYSRIPSGVDDPVPIDNELSVYPLPANDFLNFSAAGILSEVKIYSQDGVLVSNINLKSNQGTIDIKDFNSGVYVLVAVSTDLNYFVRKFIKL